MIVDTVKDWDRCKKTGRHLNKFNQFQQVHGDVLDSDINTGELEHIQLAEHYADLYRNSKKRVSSKGLYLVAKLMLWLIVNRRNKVLQINSANILSVPNFKKVVVELEALGWIDIFQGYPVKTGSRPMAVRLAIEDEVLNHQLAELKVKNMSDEYLTPDSE